MNTSNKFGMMLENTWKNLEIDICRNKCHFSAIPETEV